MAFHIDFAHVHHAFKTKARRHSCRRNSMLAGTGFSDDPGFTHALGEQDLTDRIIDFVSAGVQKVFPFQIDPRPH